MAKVLISNVLFYGFHGVYEYEREQGQKFFYDVEFITNGEGVETDDITKSVDYVSVCELVKDIAENQRFQLLEALTDAICKQILQHFALVEEVTVRVRKPAVPIHEPIDFVQVESTRKR
jgi:dihydroneopterin aldolase